MNKPNLGDELVVIHDEYGGGMELGWIGKVCKVQPDYDGSTWITLELDDGSLYGYNLENLARLSKLHKALR